ncbi:MAG: hypothetical protein U1F58_10775 [Burkholderiales bacterium]
MAVTACASAPEGGAPGVPATLATPEAKQAAVAARAKARWDALVRDDMEAAYAFLSPGSRDTTSLEKFKANTRRGAYREGRVDRVTCDGDACIVVVYVTYDHPRMKGITTPLTESWIIDAGQAWYVYGGR